MQPFKIIVTAGLVALAMFPSCQEADRVAGEQITVSTALYHSMLAPTIYCDVDGAYRGPDKSNHHSFTAKRVL